MFLAFNLTLRVEGVSMAYNNAIVQSVRQSVSDRALSFTVNLGWSIVNWVSKHRHALIVQNNKVAAALYD